MFARRWPSVYARLRGDVDRLFCCFEQERNDPAFARRELCVSATQLYAVLLRYAAQ